MRPLGVVLGVVIGISALSGTIWLARYSPLAEPRPPLHLAWMDGTSEANKEVLAKQAEQAAKMPKRTRRS